MIQTTIEEQLEKDGFVLELSVGTSMEPLLKQRQEQLLIKKPSRPLKNNDVVLFKRESGQYVLHRIISDKKTHYIIRGDNRYISEAVYPNQIIGILSGYYKNDKFIDCETNIGYILFVWFWRLSYPIRVMSRKISWFFNRVISKIRRWKNDKHS